MSDKAERFTAFFLLHKDCDRPDGAFGVRLDGPAVTLTCPGCGESISETVEYDEAHELLDMFGDHERFAEHLRAVTRRVVQ